MQINHPAFWAAIAAACTLPVAAPALGQADKYPSRPLRMIRL
mgnify:CR=1 FL=1